MSRFHNATRWVRLARSIKDRDGWRCRKCGKAGRLECDHVVPVAHGGGKWDPANLQTLCRNCHFIKSHKERQSALRGPEPEATAWTLLVEKLLG